MFRSQPIWVRRLAKALILRIARFLGFSIAFYDDEHGLTETEQSVDLQMLHAFDGVLASRHEVKASPEQQLNLLSSVFKSFDFGDVRLISSNTVYQDAICEIALLTFEFAELQIKWNMYFLEPTIANRKDPVKSILCLHGQRGDIESLIGLNREPDYGNHTAKHYCKQGFAVVVPCLPSIPVYQNSLSALSFNIGFSYLEFCVAMSVEAVSFLKRQYGKDSITGLWGISLGAFIGLLVSITDSRIDFLHSSGFFRSYKDILKGRYHNNGSEVFFYLEKGFWSKIDIFDLFYLYCPRPLFLEIGTKDKGLAKDWKTMVEKLKSKYRSENQSNALSVFVNEVGHESFVKPDIFNAVNMRVELLSRIAKKCVE